MVITRRLESTEKKPIIRSFSVYKPRIENKNKSINYWERKLLDSFRSSIGIVRIRNINDVYVLVCSFSKTTRKLLISTNLISSRRFHRERKFVRRRRFVAVDELRRPIKNRRAIDPVISQTDTGNEDR